MTGRHYLYLLLLITGGTIVGSDGMDTAWNLSPLITAFAISETLIYTGGKKWKALPSTLQYTSVGLILGTVLPLLLYHAAWSFHLVGARIGSLPYAAFWFMPVLAFVSGAVGGLAGFIIGDHNRKSYR